MPDSQTPGDTATKTAPGWQDTASGKERPGGLSRDRDRISRPEMQDPVEKRIPKIGPARRCDPPIYFTPDRKPVIDRGGRDLACQGGVAATHEVCDLLAKRELGTGQGEINRKESIISDARRAESESVFLDEIAANDATAGLEPPRKKGGITGRAGLHLDPPAVGMPAGRGTGVMIERPRQEEPHLDTRLVSWFPGPIGKDPIENTIESVGVEKIIAIGKHDPSATSGLEPRVPCLAGKATPGRVQDEPVTGWVRAGRGLPCPGGVIIDPDHLQVVPGRKASGQLAPEIRTIAFPSDQKGDNKAADSRYP